MNTNQTMRIVVTLIMGASLSTYAANDPHKDHHHRPKQEATAKSTNEYPLTTCVVSGKKLGSMEDPYIHRVADTEVRFCCKGCLPRFEKNQETYLKKLTHSKAYPLKTCVVSGEPLEDGYITEKYKNQEVRLCCKGCRKDFLKDPEPFLQKLKDAEKKAAAGDAYPIDTCVVSGMKLGSMGDPYVHMVGNKEVRFCCKACLPRFEKNQERYLKKLRPPAPSKDPHDHGHGAHHGHQH